MVKYQIIIGSLLLLLVAAEFKVVTQEFFEESFSSDDVVDWRLKSNRNGQITSICSKYSLFGGYNVFGYQAEASKRYDSGVDHQKLFISFDLFTIDSWDSETFSVLIDGVSVYSFNAHYLINKPSSRSISCGWDVISDRINTVSFSISHYRRDFILKLSSDLNSLASKTNLRENDESWGIRNLKIVAQYDPYSISIVTEEFMAQNFTDSSKDWMLTGVNLGQDFSICNSSKLFGGYNIFGKGSNASKTFTNLIDHQGIIVNMDIWMIDTPEFFDQVLIELDGQIFKIQRPDQLYSDQSSQLCGSPYYSERIVPVSIFIPHQGPEANIQIKSSYDELKDNESFGIQNLRILTFSCLNTGCNTISREYDQEYYVGNGWKSKSGVDISSKVQSCSQKSFFGGHNDTIVKKFQNITKHSGIRIFFRLLTTGNWLSNTKIKVTINDVGSIPIGAQFFNNQKVCLKPDEAIRNYYIDVPHQNDFLELKIILEGFYIDSAFSIKDLTLIAYDDDHSLQVLKKEFTDQSFSDPTGWLVSGNKQGLLVSTCGQLSVFGGYDTFGQKTNATKLFSDLPAHEFLFVTFEVFFIDTWDREDFTVMLDNEIVSITTKLDAWGGNEQLCGLTNSKEEAIFIRIFYPHISDSVKITLIDSLNELPNSESWGIRNLIISAGDFSNSNPLSPKCSDQIQPLCPPATPILCPPINTQACPEQQKIICPVQEPVTCPEQQPIVCPIEQPVLSTLLSSTKAKSN